MKPTTTLETKLEQSVEVLTLAERIGKLHKDIEARNEEMFALLTQAKKDAGPRGWLKWISENEAILGFGERQARNYLREPEVRTSDQAKEAKRQKERRAAAKAPKGAPTKLSLTPPDDDYGDGLEDTESATATEAARSGKKKTTKVLPETEPTSEQPTPKHRRGSHQWLKERVAHLEEVVRDLRETVPELPRPLSWVPNHHLFRSINDAMEVLGHVVRIAAHPVEVKEVSLGIIKLWNQQKGAQLTEKHLSHLMPKVNEAVASELGSEYGGLDRWVRLMKKIAASDPTWFTRDNFECFISTRDGRPDGLRDLEEQEGLSAWGRSAASETVEEAAS